MFASALEGNDAREGAAGAPDAAAEARELDDLRVVELATTNIPLRGSREFAFVARGTTCALALPQVCAILRPSLPAHGAPCSSMYVSNTQDAGASNPGLRTLLVLVGAARVCATAEEANAVPVTLFRLRVRTLLGDGLGDGVRVNDLRVQKERC